MRNPIDCCRRLLLQAAERPATFALDNTGNRIPAKIPMTAITTSSSMRVNPQTFRLASDLILQCLIATNPFTGLTKIRLNGLLTTVKALTHRPWKILIEQHDCTAAVG